MKDANDISKAIEDIREREAACLMHEDCDMCDQIIKRNLDTISTALAEKDAEIERLEREIKRIPHVTSCSQDVIDRILSEGGK